MSSTPQPKRWIHDLRSFHALTESEQEGVIGRTKVDRSELADEVRPPTAHIARVVIEENGEEKMLRRMFGQSDDGRHDRLAEFSRPVSGALYFVPALEALAAAMA